MCGSYVVFQANGFPAELVRKTFSHQNPPTPPQPVHEDPTEPQKIMCLPYIRGLSERIERICAPLGVKAAFKPMKTLRQTLMNVKNCIPAERKREVVYEVPCKECHLSYIGETKRTLRVRIGEHKQAVKRGGPRNGIAVHTHQSQRAINWDGAKVKRTVSGYWKRRTTEAIHIRLSEVTMNLDNGHQLPIMWNPILNPPQSPPPSPLPLFFVPVLFYFILFYFIHG